METLVLPFEDQLTQHQNFWKSHNALRNPLLVSPKSYFPHSPQCRAASSAPDFSSPVPAAGSLSGICSPRRKSPQKNAPRSRAKANKIPGVKKGRKDDLPSANVRILQRPTSQEAAMLDLAKFTGLPLVEVCSRNELPPPGENLKNKQEPKLVRSHSLSHHPHNNNSNNKQVRKPVKNQGEFFCVKNLGGFLAGEEKWAGPAFSNSPPPSSLPIPNFFLRKSGSAEPAQVDIEAATKGLKKILNLDLI